MASSYHSLGDSPKLKAENTPWTVAFQAPLSMGFSRQEYWSGLPFTFPSDLPNRNWTKVSCIAGESGKPTYTLMPPRCIYPAQTPPPNTCCSLSDVSTWTLNGHLKPASQVGCCLLFPVNDCPPFQLLRPLISISFFHTTPLVFQPILLALPS